MWVLTGHKCFGDLTFSAAAVDDGRQANGKKDL